MRSFDSWFATVRSSEGKCPAAGIVGKIVSDDGKRIVYSAMLNKRRTQFSFDRTWLRFLYYLHGPGAVLDHMIEIQIEAARRLGYEPSDG